MSTLTEARRAYIRALKEASPDDAAQDIIQFTGDAQDHLDSSLHDALHCAGEAFGQVRWMQAGGPAPHQRLVRIDADGEITELP